MLVFVLLQLSNTKEGGEARVVGKSDSFCECEIRRKKKKKKRQLREEKKRAMAL